MQGTETAAWACAIDTVFIMDYPKNSIVVGSWDDLAFQLAIDDAGQKKAEPLSIDMVDMYGFHCIPHVGPF
jgi:hypothetical protein